VNDEEEPEHGSVGTRMVLACGHHWTLPLGLPPEVVAADLLRHHSVCDVDSVTPFLARQGSPGAWLVPGEVGP